MPIANLSTVAEVSASDSIPLASGLLGSDARVTLAILLAWLQSQLASEGGFVTQYAAPAATGFTVTIAPPNIGTSVHLILTPAAGYATGTITLPGTPTDQQEVLVNCTQAVTALTVNGGTVNGVPTALTANAFFKVRYDGVLGVWYRVG